MNKNVLKAMVYLCWAYIIAFLIIKVFFPEQLLLVVENQRVIAVGNYVDTHLWLLHLLTYIIRCITFLIFICACCKKMVFIIYTKMLSFV
jgi:hypothetical protein